MNLALYQPDIPQNTGTLMRLCACFGIHLDIIEPCGFPLDDTKVRRAAMDYIDHLSLKRHRSWDDFFGSLGLRRLVLMTTKGATPYTAFAFRADDIILLGQESAGVPNNVHEAATARLVVPIKEPMRSLNVALCGAIVLSEALRQLRTELSPF
jgi:tRNA (cytidine/uridine-2'-O-)-methyltransferase